MSAVKEWFGGYNTIFRYIREKYGADELDSYLCYIADEANSDISEKIKAGTLAEAADWFARNFEKDGAGIDVMDEDSSTTIFVNHCAAYDFMNCSTNPYFKPDPGFCDCCMKLNKRICANAGIGLDVADVTKNGKCRWIFTKEAK